jgi:hypothetical protein
MTIKKKARLVGTKSQASMFGLTLYLFIYLFSFKKQH